MAENYHNSINSVEPNTKDTENLNEENNATGAFLTQQCRTFDGSMSRKKINLLLGRYLDDDDVLVKNPSIKEMKDRAFDNKTNRTSQVYWW